MIIMIYGGKHMKLMRITISGFKNISNCRIDIHKITGLLSVNSYGKSNLLNGIEFGIDFMTSPHKIKDDMLGWKQGFPRNKNMNNKQFSFELSLLHSIEEKEYEIIYGFSFDWRMRENDNGKINNEYLLMREKSEKQKYSHYIKRDSESGAYKSSYNGRCNNNIHIAYNELIINKLQAYDDLFYSDIIEELNNFEIYIDRHLDSKEAFQPDPIVRKNSDDLKLATADNIPRTLFKLEQQYKEKYEYLIDIYKQLFPKIENIKIKQFKLSTEDGQSRLFEDIDILGSYEVVEYVYMLFCKEYNMNTTINFQQMSDGARRILLLLTNLVLADINHISLFCVEEPENSIHPGLFRKYIEVINDLSDNTKILITSHSPYLVDYLQPDNIYIGCSHATDIVNFRKIKKTAINKLYRDASHYDMNYGEYLFDLFSDDNEELNKYVE